MRVSDKVTAFLDTVCEQIRFKTANPLVRREIEGHIEDQVEAFVATGDDEEVAIDKAILSMGDAVAIGTELDAVHKPKNQWFMYLLVGLFLLVGYMATYSVMIDKWHSPTDSSIAPYLIGTIIVSVFYHLEYSKLHKYRNIVVATCFTLYAAILIMITRHYVLVTMITIFVQYIPQVILAFYLFCVRNHDGKFLLKSQLVIMAIFILTAMTTGYDVALLMMVPTVATLLFAIRKGYFNVKVKWYAIAPLVLYTIAVIVFFVTPMIPTILDPFSQRETDGFVMSLVRDLIANSQLVGSGTLTDAIGEYIPVLTSFHTSHILVALTFEYGLWIFIAIAFLYTLFLVLGFKKLSKIKSVMGSMLAFSILFTFAYQAGLYMLGNLGIGQNSFVTLPFISYGMSSLFINCALQGILLSIFRTGDYYFEVFTAPFVYMDGGKLVLNFKKKDSSPLISFNENKIAVDMSAYKKINKKKAAFALLIIPILVATLPLFVYLDSKIGLISDEAIIEDAIDERVIYDYEYARTENVAAALLYGSDIEGSSYDIYVNRDGFSFGYFFRAGGSSSSVDRGVERFTTEQFEDAVYISMNSDSIVRIEIEAEDDVKTEIEVEAGEPFVYIFDKSDEVRFFNQRGEEIKAIVRVY